jgi:septal ring factor EnvC (AmiA/AmiB activator)
MSNLTGWETISELRELAERTEREAERAEAIARQNRYDDAERAALTERINTAEERINATYGVKGWSVTIDPAL